MNSYCLTFSAVLCVALPITYEGTGDDFDGVRVPSTFEVLTGGVDILDSSVLRVPVMSKQIS